MEETVTQPVVQDNTEQFATSATNATPADTTSADFFNLDFSSINAQLTDSNHVDFSEIKFPNGSLPATSDLLDIDFGNLPVEPTPPTPGTPSIEVHFATSDQNSEVSNETKSDTDSNAPTDSWSVSTQYPESRGDMESGRDDVKSEQSLDDKSQLAEDGSDAFDFPTPKGSTHSEQKDDAPSTNMTDAVEFGDFPAPNTQSEQSTSEAAKSSEAGSADGPLTPVRPSEDKVAEAQDDTLSVSSDTAPVTNTNDFAFEDEFKAAPGPSDDSNSGSEGKTGHSLEQSTEQSGLEAPKTAPENVSEVTPAQPSEDFFAAVEAPETSVTTTSADFDFPAPSTDDQPQQEQNKLREDESKAATTNDFAFETPAPSNNNNGTNDFTFDNEVTSATSAEDKQPEEPGHVQPGEPTQVKSDNDFEFEGELTSTQTLTAAQAVTEEKQPEHVEENKAETKPVRDETDNAQQTQPVSEKSDNGFDFETEFNSAPTTTAAEEKQPEHVEEGTAVEAEPSTVKIEHDGEFEGEFTATPAVPNKTEDETKHAHSDEKKDDNDVKSDSDFEFEGEFTAAPTPSVPATNTNIDTNISNTNTNASTNQDDDDFFDSDFQAAPTVPQVPQEQPQAPKSGGTFEADFDEDFEDFAQAPTTTQPPVQPVQPPQAVTAPTPWLFEGDEAAVRDRVHALVSTLFPAPAPSKALPDINTTVEEKLEELRSSAPAVDAAPVVPAPSVFAEHLKALLASVVSAFCLYSSANRIVDRSFH